MPSRFVGPNLEWATQRGFGACDQIEFHRNKEKREGQARRKLASASGIVLRVTIAAALVHLALPSWEHWVDVTVKFWVDNIVAFLALLFPAIAAALAGMEAHREHLRLEKRSANMAPQLEYLRRQMAASTDDRERFESLLYRLDELMLRETQDWLMLMRYVEIKAS